MRILVITVFFCSAVLGGRAQQCDAYFPVKEGTRMVMESFDKKNKFLSRSTQTVTESASTPDGTYAARVVGEVTDNKEKSLGQLDYEIKCDGENAYISMNSMLNPEQMSAYENMEVTVEGDFLELPSNLESGMELEDASIIVKVNNSGLPIMTLTLEIYDRKVEGFESITTPAGTFECVKIVYAARSQMGQAIPIKVNTYGAEWLAKGTGVIRVESYDKKQNLTGYTVLAEFKAP